MSNHDRSATGERTCDGMVAGVRRRHLAVAVAQEASHRPGGMQSQGLSQDCPISASESSGRRERESVCVCLFVSVSVWRGRQRVARE